MVTPEFDSPYFRPEFAQTVAIVRKDVEVAVLEVDGAPAGFWPFQRTKWNIATPVGGRMSDFQGVVCHKCLRWNAEQLIRGCGLAAWEFDHLLAWQQPFRAHHWKTAPSPYMDLSGGFDGYRSTAHAQTISQVLRKRRKLEREIGPLRIQAHTADPSVFETLVHWKNGTIL
jgi:CelD/BcsL family acetyltransferase involved in cellulose biosynthesis